MKRLLALIMVLAMVAAMVCGCSSKEKEKTKKIESSEDLIGTWTMECDIETMMAMMEDSDDMSMLTSFEDAGFEMGAVSFEVEFTDDGEMITDMQSVGEWTLDTMNDFVSWLKKGDNLYAFYESMTGMDKDELMEQMEDAGISEDDLYEELDASMEASLEEMENSMEDLEDTVDNYEFEDGKLYIWGEDEDREDAAYIEIKAKGDTLTITDFGED